MRQQQRDRDTHWFYLVFHSLQRLFKHIGSDVEPRDVSTEGVLLNPLQLTVTLFLKFPLCLHACIIMSCVSFPACCLSHHWLCMYTRLQLCSRWGVKIILVPVGVAVNPLLLPLGTFTFETHYQCGTVSLHLQFQRDLLCIRTFSPFSSKELSFSTQILNFFVPLHFCSFPWLHGSPKQDGDLKNIQLIWCIQTLLTRKCPKRCFTPILIHMKWGKSFFAAAYLLVLCKDVGRVLLNLPIVWGGSCRNQFSNREYTSRLALQLWDYNIGQLSWW